MSKYLTYSPGRRVVWKEHNSFPAKAIALWTEGGSWRQSKTLFLVYKISEDREQITLVPPTEWDL